MIKKINILILVVVMVILPLNAGALCDELFRNKIRGYEWHGDIPYNEYTVGSGEVLEYILQTEMYIYDDGDKTYFKTVKPVMPTGSEVSCSVIPQNNDYYTYSNGIFTLNEDKIPEYSEAAGWMSNDYEIVLAKIHCQMPTVEKYNRGYNFDFYGEYERVEERSETKKTNTIKEYSRNKIDLVNPTYLKSLQRPTANFNASFEGINFDCQGFICSGETSSDKVTLTYSSNNPKFKLNYGVGKYMGLFEEPQDLKMFDLTNLSGKATINLNYGNNFIGAVALSDGSTDFETVGKVLDEYHFFICLDEIDDLNFTGEVKEEKIWVINRVDARSNDSTLKSLSISNGKINFNQNLKHYAVSVGNDVKEVTVSSKLNHDKASYVSGFGNRTVKLNEGKNDVLVKVKAENGEESVYTIVVTREPSNNNNLVSIGVDDKVIKVIKDKLKYTINVDNKITKVNITGLAEHEKATVTIDNNRDLVVGSNVISISVIAPNGEKKIYEIDIVRADLISSNADLKSIEITNYKLDFSSNIKKYNLTIKDEKDLEIKIVTDSDKAKVLVTGNDKLEDGSIIKIKVTAEDKKTENIYEIHITKEKKEIPFLMIFGIIGLIISVVGLIIVFAKKKGDSTSSRVSENTNINSEISVENTVENTLESAVVSSEVMVENTDTNNEVVAENTDSKNDASYNTPVITNVVDDDII